MLYKQTQFRKGRAEAGSWLCETKPICRAGKRKLTDGQKESYGRNDRLERL